MSFHTILIVGRLGRDPEMRFTPSGTAVTTLNIATDRAYTGQDGKQVKETIWFRVSVWGKQAESANDYLTKGKLVLVEGRMTPDKTGNPRIWTDKDGSARASFEVTAQTVRFLSPKTESDKPSAEGNIEDELDAEAAKYSDDIPF